MHITQKEIITSVLYFLGGGAKSIDLDTLVVSCFRIFPSKFSMDRFPEYPHFDRVEKTVNVITRDGLIKRSQARHYQLTEKGIEWVKKNSKVIELIDKKKKQEKLSFQKILNFNIDEQQYGIEIKKLKRTEAYEKYKSGDKDKISMIDFMAFMKVDVFAKRDLFDRKVKRIKSICQRNSELKKIFDYLESKYALDFGYFNKAVGKMGKALEFKEG